MEVKHPLTERKVLTSRTMLVLGMSWTKWNYHVELTNRDMNGVFR
jgi:hypothetical protein